QDPQEGPRAVQAPLVGPPAARHDPRRPAGQDAVPLPEARRRGLARDGRAVHPTDRAPSGSARRPRRRGDAGPDVIARRGLPGAALFAAVAFVAACSTSPTPYTTSSPEPSLSATPTPIALPASP